MTDTSDKSLDPRTTAILTEHFGFAPLVLIDEIINAVNEIMYKGTEAIESFLKEQKNIKTSGIFTEISLDEIETGVGKLETLLEFTVDSYFDKFELYCFRNVLNIPKDLIPHVVLNHQRGIEFNNEKIKDKDELDKKIDDLRNKIALELQLRKILKFEITKVNSLYQVLKSIQTSLKSLEEYENNPELIKKLKPIDETMYFVNTEIKNLMDQLEKISTKIRGNLQNHKFSRNMRDEFLDGRTILVLKEAGLLQENTGDIPTEEREREVNHE